MAIIKDVVFIIKNKRFKEADKIITFFGKKFGKSASIAIGAQRPETRKSGNLESGSIVKVSLIEGKKFNLIAEAETIKSSEADKEVGKILLYIAELVDKYTVEGDPDEELFDILAHNISTDMTLFHANEIHLILMQKAGLLPDFLHCSKTNAEITTGTQVYLSEHGPVVSDFSNPLPMWPQIKSDYFIILADHKDYQGKTNEKVEKNLFKILNYIAEQSLEKTLLSKNLFKHSS